MEIVNKSYLKVRLDRDDLAAFQRINALTKAPLDLTDTIESHGAAGREYIEYALEFTKKHLASLFMVLKTLIPSLKKEVRFEHDGEVFQFTNFTTADEVIRIHEALLKDKLKASLALKRADKGDIQKPKSVQKKQKRPPFKKR